MSAVEETSGGDRQSWNIDQLAHHTDTLSTTIRLYQHRGLLPPPRRAGRTAIYEASHVERIELIADLQRRGHSLAGIADLLASHERGAPLTQLLGMATLREPESIRLPLVDLARILGGEALQRSDFVRATAAGLIEIPSDGNGTEVIVTDRRFVQIGSALVDLGIPASIVLDEWEALITAMTETSSRFATVFEAYLLPGLADASTTDVVATVDRLASLARDVTAVALEGALRNDIERFVGGHADDEP